MQAEKLNAFIISTLDYGDSDRIVSLFTLEHGRMRAFARGARKSRKRFGAALEPFARIEVHARIKEGLSGLVQASIHSIYPQIRLDLEKIAHALYACELVEAITPEGQPLPRLYRLLAAYLDRLEAAQPREDERRFFEINLLNILGYRPSLETCSRCGASYGDDGAILLEEGNISCCSCAVSKRSLSNATLKLLQTCLGTGTFGLTPFPPELLTQAGALLDDALSAHTGRRLKSLNFLRQVTG